MAIATSAATQSVTAALRSVDIEASSAAERNVSIDCVRGFAVLGILFRNIYLFGMPSSAYAVPVIWGDAQVLNILSWAFTEIFVDGVMRALFSMLFGASALMILQTNIGSTPVARVDRYFRRLLCLMGLGLLHGYFLLWTYDVLFLYGLLGMFLFPLRNLSARTLIATAACMIVVSTIISMFALFLDELSTEQTVSQLQPTIVAPVLISNPIEQLNLDTDDDEILKTLLEDWVAEYQIRSGGYVENFLATIPMTFEQQTTELFKTHMVDVGALMLIGMALFKLGVLGAERSNAFYTRMAVVSYGIGLTLNLADICGTFGYGPTFLQTDTWTYIGYDVGRVSIALGHLAAIILLVKNGWFRSLVNLFASAGRMALTNYVAQSVICITLFFGFGFGLFAKFEHYQLLLIAVLIGIVLLFSSTLCLRVLGAGPLEWLMRLMLCDKSRLPVEAHGVSESVLAPRS